MGLLSLGIVHIGTPRSLRCNMDAPARHEINGNLKFASHGLSRVAEGDRAIASIPEVPAVNCPPKPVGKPEREQSTCQ